MKLCTEVSNMKDYMSENYFEQEQTQDGIVGFGKFTKVNTDKMMSLYNFNCISVSYKKATINDEKSVRLSFICRLESKEGVDYEKQDESVSANFNHYITLTVIVPINEAQAKWLTFKGTLEPNMIYGLEGFIIYGGISLRAKGIMIGNEWIGKQTEKPNAQPKQEQ